MENHAEDLTGLRQRDDAGCHADVVVVNLTKRMSLWACRSKWWRRG